MANDPVAELVRRTHEGEVLGAALFARLVSLETDEGRRTKLRAAQLLEEQTRELAERLASELDVPLGDRSATRDAGEQVADALAGLAWTDTMRAIADATGNYRALYQDLGERLGAEHPAIQGLLGHERALNAFADAESRGEPDALAILVDALDAEHRPLVQA
jgi:hypothetical protein